MSLSEGAIVEGGLRSSKIRSSERLVRVNKYVYNGIDKTKITPKIKRNLVYSNWIHAYFSFSSSD